MFQENALWRLENDYFILLFTRKYFCKKGYIRYNYDWSLVFAFLNRFVLKYKFAFDLKSTRISFSLVHPNKQLENKFHFLRTFIKLNGLFKWTLLDFDKLHIALNKIQYNTLKALVKQS